MHKDLHSFHFRGQAIAFETSLNEIYINASQMARVFNKRVGKFLRLNSTAEYMDSLSKKLNTTNESDLYFTQRSPGKYTKDFWFHRKLAIKFANWLNTDFRLWVDEKIEQLDEGIPYRFNPKVHQLLDAWSAVKDIDAADKKAIKEINRLIKKHLTKPRTYTIAERLKDRKLSHMRKALDLGGIGKGVVSRYFTKNHKFPTQENRIINGEPRPVYVYEAKDFIIIDEVINNELNKVA